MARSWWMVFSFLFLLPGKAFAQPGERLGVKVEFDATIRNEFALNQESEYQREMRRLSDCLVDNLNASYWGDFCWELTSDLTKAKNYLLVMLSEDSEGDWFIEAKLRSNSTRGWGKLKVKTSPELIASGVPRLASFQDLLNGWFCDGYLSQNETAMHQALRERLPVGRGIAQLNGTSAEYLVYLPEKFQHFYRSSFSIDTAGKLVIVEGSGSRTPDQFENARCVRFVVNQPTSPQVPPPFQGPAYLIKYVKPNGTSVGAQLDDNQLPTF